MMKVEPGAIERATTIGTYTAGGGAVIFGMTANEFAAVIGAIIAVMTFITNLLFKWKHLQVARSLAASKPDCAVCAKNTSLDD